MKDSTLISIVLVALFMLFGIMAWVDTYEKTKIFEYSSKAGLEQCPNPLASVNSKSVIWVKDCEKFTTLMKEK